VTPRYEARLCQEGQIGTADPGGLVLALYDGAIGFLRQAKADLEAQRPAAAHEGITRAEKIVMELLACLREEGGEITSNLKSIYTFILEQLVAANMSKDAEKVGAVIELLLPLRDAWQEAAAKARAR